MKNSQFYFSTKIFFQSFSIYKFFHNFPLTIIHGLCARIIVFRFYFHICEEFTKEYIHLITSFFLHFNNFSFLFSFFFLKFNFRFDSTLNVLFLNVINSHKNKKEKKAFDKYRILTKNNQRRNYRGKRKKNNNK